MPPLDLVPLDTSYREAPTVTVLEPRGPVELEYAEPSPVMGVVSRAWRRLVFLFKAALVLVAIGTYPALVLNSNNIDDTPVKFADGYEWTVGEVGKIVTVAAREIQGPGWAADRPSWHWQARLTAMPAWQEGVTGAASDFTRLIAAQTGDEDLATAARLLAPEGEAMIDRLTAAAEVLARYDSRVENGHANAPTGTKALSEKLQLTTSWAQDSRSSLAVQIRSAEGWPASYDDIRVFYTAKARAHVAHEVLSAALIQEADAITARGLTATKTEALELWHRAAEQKPLFVINQRGDAALLGNHLTGMAFLLDEATAATVVLAEALDQPVTTPEDGKSAGLAATMPPSP